VADDTADLSEDGVQATPAAESASAYLDNQLAWHDRKAVWNQKRYRSFQVVQIVTAASIPVVAGTGASGWITGGLGAVVVVSQGISELYNFHGNWLSYRRTASELTKERLQYMSRSGPYADDPNPDRMLAQNLAQVLERSSDQHASPERQANKPTP
jgi:hypothetical protein